MKDNYLMFKFKDNLMATNNKNVNEVIGLESLVDTNKIGLKATIYKGEIIPVIDPQSIFYINSNSENSESKILITTYYNDVFGILVDSLEGIEKFEEEYIEKPTLKEKKFVKSLYKGIKIVDIKDFIVEEFISWSKSLRENELEVVVNAEKTFRPNLEENDYIKKEISRELINMIIDKENELNEVQVEKISEIQKKIEGLL